MTLRSETHARGQLPVLRIKGSLLYRPALLESAMGVSVWAEVGDGGLGAKGGMGAKSKVIY